VYKTYLINTMKKTLIIFLVFTLSACGWHLRGSETADGSSAYNKPLNLVITSTDNHGPLMNSLRQSLHSYNITEVSSGVADAFKLDLKELKLDKRAAGVGSDALVNVYELILYVDYQISSPEKTLTSPNTRGSVSRTYNFEVNQANFSEQEEALIMREMHRDLAQQILRRLKVLGNKSNPAP
jgi:LPS-assembly lipoprotein